MASHCNEKYHSKYDPEQVQNFLQLLRHKDSAAPAEIRILPKDPKRSVNGQQVGTTVSGYYNDYTKAAKDIEPHDGKAAIYVTLNAIEPRLMARAKNRLEFWAKHTTSDADIIEILWLPIDVDPIRPSGISSTTEELQSANIVRNKIISEVFHPLEIPVLRGSSGNGAHGLIPLIGYPNDGDTQTEIKRLLNWLSQKFSNEHVSVDSTVGNPARIWKLYGTKATKGDNTTEAPHRRAGMSCLTNLLSLLTCSLLSMK